MELDELKTLVTDFGTLKSKIEQETPSRNISEYLKQLNPSLHDIKDAAKRPDKVIITEQGTTTAPVARLPISFQKKIAGMAAAFLCGKPIKLRANAATNEQQSMLAALRKAWDLNKLYYDTLEIARILFSLTEVAEIWYSERTADETYWNGTPLQGSRIRLRMKIVSGETGDSLYPVFNSNGDMISFARSYVIKKDGKELNRFDVYTDEKNYFASYVGNQWEVKEENNFFGKIPVIYYSQPNPEWADVQDLISRLEVLISNNADTNDYFGSPMVKVKGTVKGFAKKGEQGKVIELESGADAEYMSWDQSPKNVELEYKILRSLIFDNTDTPDISFEQMKSLGTYSGIALKMLFLAPHLKCAAKEGNFGKCIQRRINFLKTAMNKIKIGAVAEGMTLDVSPEFEYYLPADDESFINMLSVATGNKPVLSQKSAVSISPLTSNADTEYQQIQEEENSPAALDRIN